MREAAQAIRSTTRLYDAVGRYGGEEFLIVLPGCDQTNATSHAERLRAAVERICLTTLAGDLRVTASLGVTVLNGNGSANTECLIQAADTALYRAKNAGRNCVEFEGAGELTSIPGTMAGIL